MYISDNIECNKMITPPAVIYPPNRALERNLMPSKSAVLYDYLLFLDANKNGEFVLGSSNLSGTYWEGILCHYKSDIDLQTNKHCGYYISTTSVSDAKFVSDTHVLLAEDTGHLKLLVINDVGDPNIKCQDIVSTSALVEQLSVWPRECKALTCANATMGLWDVNMQAGITPVAEYSNYHLERILSVDANTTHPNLFASASADRKVCVWDDRLQMPATVLYENEFSEMTSVVWDPTRQNYLSAGSRGGSVYCLDMRAPKEFVNHHHCFDTAIHKMVHNSKAYLGICGDSNEVVMLETDKDYEVVYRGTQHEGFVRGLKWLDGILYSCGFDKKIIKHGI